MRFLEALCERMDGKAGIFGVDLEPWLRGPGVEDILIAEPDVSESLAFAVLELGSRTRVTLLVGPPAEHQKAIWLDTWRTIWPAGVRLLASSEVGPLVGVKRGGEWKIISASTAAEMDRGRIESGLLHSGDEALKISSDRIGASHELQKGKAFPAQMIPLRAGTKTSEKELVGYLFDDVVEQMTIEDPHLFEPRHEKRLRAWLDLPRTQTRACAIKTCRPDQPGTDKEQNAMFARLAAHYKGKHGLAVRYGSRRDMHDRSVSVTTASGAFKILLPKGLDFIDDSGVVVKDTSVTIVSLPDGF